MIPETPDNILETNTTGRKIKFTFQANRHLFDAFSKNLYSNPHDSVVREIISNAIDSNTRSGNKDKPLTIILNNEFIVQDSGTGMTPYVIENVYSVYGNSDKRETNDEIGMFGFGAKSCFAIADQFVVETIPGDGYKYVWVIYKDLTGSGEINLTSQIETAEPTGTKVRVPIKATDYTNMKTAILKYINFLKPWPVTHFANNFMAQQPNILIENDDFVEYKKGSVSGNYNILYDGWMPYYIPYTKIPECIMIKIEMGKARLSASRENITITEELKTLISNKLEKYWKDLLVHTKKRVMEIQDPIVIIQELESIISKHYKYFDNSIEINIDKHPVYGDFKWPDGFSYEQLYERHSYTRRIRPSSNNLQYNSHLQLIYANTSDLEKVDSPYYKIKMRHLIDKGYRQLVLITDEHVNQTMSPIFKPLFDNAIDIVKYKVPRTTSSNGVKRKYEKNTISAAVFTDNKYINSRVKFKDGQYVYGFRNHELDVLPKDSNFKFCVVTKRVTKKLQDLPNWKTVGQYIQEKSNKFTKDEMNLFQTQQAIKHSKNFIKKLFDKKLIDVNNIDADYLSKIDKNDMRLIELAVDYGFIESPETQVDKFIDDIYSKYPLLSYIYEYKLNEPDAFKHVEEYVKMVQEKNQCKTSA